MQSQSLKMQDRLSIVNFFFYPCSFFMFLVPLFSHDAHGEAVSRDDLPWQCSAAKLRIRVEPGTKRPHLLRVDLPLSEKDSYRGVSAFLSGGGMIPASPVYLQNRMVAVEVLVPGLSEVKSFADWHDDETWLPIEVYLLAEEKSLLPCPPESRRPIQLKRQVRKLTTRPFTSAEMVCLMAKLKQKPAVVGLSNFAATMPRPAWNTPAGKKNAILHWSTELLLQDDTELSLGAEPEQTAWFMFLDGRAVADWKSCDRLPQGGRTGPATSFKAGFHRFDLFAVQRKDEAIPVPLRRFSGGRIAPLSVSELFSIHRPKAMLLERKEAGVPFGFRVENIKRYITVDTAAEITCFDISSVGLPADDRELVTQALRIADRAIEGVGEGTFAVLGNRLPLLELALTHALGYREKIVMPPRQLGVCPMIVRPRLHVVAVPPIIAAGRRLECEVSLELKPNILPKAETQLVFEFIQLDDSGRHLAQPETVVAGANVAQKLNVHLHDSASMLEIRCLFAGKPLAEPVCIAIVRPKMVSEALSAAGNSFFLDGCRAVLVCDSLERLPVESNVIKAVPGGAGRAELNVAIVDDFWAVASGPNADLLPETWLNRSPAMQVRRYSVVDAGRGAAAELRKFCVFGQALAVPRPQMVLLAVGQNELAAGMLPPELCLHLLFLAQAVRASGSVPVLLALPDLPEVSPENSRKTALLTKELALKLGVPIVDAYAPAIQEKGLRGRFADFFWSYDHEMSLRTPNNRGRVWLCQLLQKCFTSSAAKH